MSDLSDKLMNMKSLDSIDRIAYSGVNETIAENIMEYSDVFQQECISNNLAQALLGEDYSPNCTYKLCTIPEATLLLKIDESVPENSEVNNEQRIKEYVLQVNDVQSYDEMCKSILNYGNGAVDKSADYTVQPTSFFSLMPMEKVMLGVFVAMFIIFIGILLFLVSGGLI